MHRSFVFVRTKCTIQRCVSVFYHEKARGVFPPITDEPCRRKSAAQYRAGEKPRYPSEAILPRRLPDAEQGSVVPGRRFFTLYKRYTARYASLRSFTARVLLIFAYFLSVRTERKYEVMKGAPLSD